MRESRFAGWKRSSSSWGCNGVRRDARGAPTHSAMVGRQTLFLALIVPLVRVAMVDGRRGAASVWPAALLGGRGLAGREGDILRRVLGWSLVLLLVMCVIAYLQSTSVLSWMVP
jgi:L-lactate permease